MNYPPAPGGSSTRAYNIAKGLLKNNVEPIVLASYPRDFSVSVNVQKKKIFYNDFYENYSIIRVYIPSLKSRSFFNQLIQFVFFILFSLVPIYKINNIDGIFCSNPNIFSIFSGMIYRRFKKCPLILNVDDLWPEELINLEMINSKYILKIGELISNIAYNSADHIVVISPHYKKLISIKYSIPPKKITFLPGGVDLNLFVSKRKNESDDFICLYIGSFSIAYDFDVILKSAKILDKYKKIKFIIFGDGTQYNYIYNVINLLKLNNVKLIKKTVPRNMVSKILSLSDVLLLTIKIPNYTGISSKIYEYQASARPIVCSSTGASADFINYTNSGLCTSNGNYKAFARNILKLYKNKSLRSSLSENGLNYVRNNATPKILSKKLLKIFNKLERGFY